jgi:hypothetical protein
MDWKNMSSAETFSSDELIKNTERSTTKILAQNIDQIELAISAGISHDKIIAELAAKGIVKISKPAFKLALYRIRKRRVQEEKATAALVNVVGKISS